MLGETADCARAETSRLKSEVELLRVRLEEAEQALEAIRTGQVDSLVVHGPEGPRVFSLQGEDHAYRILVEAMNEGAATLDDDGTILYANTRLAQMLETPLERVMGSPISRFLPDHSRAAFDALLREANGGDSRGELELEASSGRCLPAYLSLSVILDQGHPRYCLVAADLRPQKRIEAILAAERLARPVLEQAVEAIVVCDAEGRIVRANRAASELCGTNPLLVSFETAFPVVFETPQPHSSEAGMACRVLRGEVLRALPARLERSDGPRYLLVSAAPLTGDAGEAVGCVVSIIDVTERKRLERLYAVLSEVNETIVRSSDEQRLLGDVCCILAEQGGFPLVWIGLTQDDRVPCVAMAGPGVEYGATLDVGVHGELGEGPIGTSIREDRPIVNDDFATNVHTLAWRDAALQAGFRASVAFPLHKNDRVIGALALYAKHPRAFDAAQVSLIESLCADVSYALDALEQERLRSDAERALRIQSELATELLEALDAGSVLRMVTERIHSLAEGAVVAGTEFDVRSQRLTVCSVQSTPEVLERAAAILGCSPIGLSLRVQERPRRWSCPGMTPVTGGLRELFLEQVPAAVCAELERTFGVQGMFSMVCAHEADILGTVSVFTRRPGPLPRQELIEALVAQAALALGRIRAERAREESEERFRLVLESSSDGVWIHTLDGVIREVNDAYCAMSGYSRAELVGTHVSSIEAVETPEAVAEYTSGLIGAGGHARYESRHRRKDGSTFDVDITAVYVERWENIAIFVRDVTERKKAELALRAREARLGVLSRTADRLLAAPEPQRVVDDLCQEVMEHLGCDVFFNFLYDAAANRLRLNACAGIPDEQAQRIRWLDFGVAICGCVARDKQRIIAEDIQHSSDTRADLVRSFGIQAYCCHPLLAQGHVLGTLSFGTRRRVRFPSDEIELMHTVADQVATAIQRLHDQQALRLANEQLVEADARKNEFLAVLSHELRNPLAPITSCLYILDHVPPGGEKANRARQVIARQVTQLSSLVNDLLDVTRITRNKIQLQKERLDLNGVLRRAAEDNRSLFEQASVGLEVVPAGGPVFVKADRTRVAQIIGNLLQNAAKFVRAGGHARLSLETEGQQAVLRVSDDGVGMEPSTLRRLFQPFMQADQSLDRSKGGLGLGLALVKGLVELHGGSISAHSGGLGAGAEFTVKLPLDLSTSIDEEPAVLAEPRPRRRVLIIEDNVDAAESLREALALGSHEVRVAYSGPEGLALAREFAPEVLLCDIGLPGMDGFEVARTFQDDSALKEVFRVALSGYATPEDVERAAEAGFERHLAKPPSLEKLDELLMRLRAGP